MFAKVCVGKTRGLLGNLSLHLRAWDQHLSDKKEEILTPATVCMSLEDVLLGEMSQTQKAKTYRKVLEEAE